MQTRRELKSSRVVPFLLGVGAALLFALILFYSLMQPPAKDLRLMIILMACTSALSLALAFLAYRSGWIHRSTQLRWSLAGGYVLSGSLVLLNVWITARMMFINSHDLTLATFVLLFATGIAVSVAFFLSETTTTRIHRLNLAVGRVAGGDLDTRIPVAGKDELALLAQDFNRMVAKLQESERRQRELDLLRRALIAWVSHDLRTPLTSMRAIVEALVDGIVEDDATRQRYLKTVQSEIGSFSHLIDDLFELAQLDAGGLRIDIRPSSIADLISETIESFAETARKQGSTLSGRASPGVALVPMDIQRIGQVLANLTANALRHTQPGGQVDIHAFREMSCLRIEVIDTGEGIRSEEALCVRPVLPE